MINQEELELRQAFEARCRLSYPQLPLDWDTDYDEYVCGTTEDVFQGWKLAHSTPLFTFVDRYQKEHYQALELLRRVRSSMIPEHLRECDALFDTVKASTEEILKGFK